MTARAAVWAMCLGASGCGGSKASDADADADVDTDADTDSGSDTATESGSETSTGSDTATETSSGTESESEACGGICDGSLDSTCCPSGECENLLADSENCGECGNVCGGPSADRCGGGRCVCGAGSPVDPAQACAEGETCVADAAGAHCE